MAEVTGWHKNDFVCIIVGTCRSVLFHVECAAMQRYILHR